MSQKKNDTLSVNKASAQIPNRFLLSATAAKRARQLQEGAKPLIDVSPETPPILIALREIQAKKINVDLFEEEIIEDQDANTMLNEINDYLDHDFKEEDLEPEDKDSAQTPKKESKAKNKSVSA